MVRSLIVVLSSCMLGGCFFFYIPGGVIDALGDGLSGSFGNACVGVGVGVGDRVAVNGRTGTVERISGASGRCFEPTPILAQVAY